MDLFEAMATLVAVKKYDRRDVPEELISQILTAATFAPSAGNTQPWEFIVVKDKKMKKELSIAALQQKHVDEAPVVIVVCANLEKTSIKFMDRGKELYAIQDTAAAIQNMLLVAHALGLGAVWTRAFEEEKVQSLLKVPSKLRPVGLLSIGFPLPYEETEKPTIIPFENLSWSEEYGKELPWFRKYGKQPRFQVKSFYEFSQGLKKELEEKKEAAVVKKEGESVFERFARFIRKPAK